jgi:hypothetical protein
MSARADAWAATPATPAALEHERRSDIMPNPKYKTIQKTILIIIAVVISLQTVFFVPVNAMDDFVITQEAQDFFDLIQEILNPTTPYQENTAYPEYEDDFTPWLPDFHPAPIYVDPSDPGPWPPGARMSPTGAYITFAPAAVPTLVWQAADAARLATEAAMRAQGVFETMPSLNWEDLPGEISDWSVAQIRTLAASAPGGELIAFMSDFTISAFINLTSSFFTRMTAAPYVPASRFRVIEPASTPGGSPVANVTREEWNLLQNLVYGATTAVIAGFNAGELDRLRTWAATVQTCGEAPHLCYCPMPTMQVQIGGNAVPKIRLSELTHERRTVAFQSILPDIGSWGLQFIREFNNPVTFNQLRTSIGNPAQQVQLPQGLLTLGSPTEYVSHPMTRRGVYLNGHRVSEVGSATLNFRASIPGIIRLIDDRNLSVGAVSFTGYYIVVDHSESAGVLWPISFWPITSRPTFPYDHDHTPAPGIGIHIPAWSAVLDRARAAAVAGVRAAQVEDEDGVIGLPLLDPINWSDLLEQLISGGMSQAQFGAHAIVPPVPADSDYDIAPPIPPIVIPDLEYLPGIATGVTSIAVGQQQAYQQAERHQAENRGFWGNLWDWLRRILDAILGLVSGILDGLRDMLMFLFVPADGAMDAVFDDFRTLLSEAIPHETYLNTINILTNPPPPPPVGNTATPLALTATATTYGIAPLNTSPNTAFIFPHSSNQPYSFWVRHIWWNIYPILPTFRIIITGLYVILMLLYNSRQLHYLIRGSAPPGAGADAPAPVSTSDKWVL